MRLRMSALVPMEWGHAIRKNKATAPSGTAACPTLMSANRHAASAKPLVLAKVASRIGLLGIISLAQGKACNYSYN